MFLCFVYSQKVHYLCTVKQNQTTMLTLERKLEVAYMKIALTVIEEPSFLKKLGEKRLDEYRDLILDEINMYRRKLGLII